MSEARPIEPLSFDAVARLFASLGDLDVAFVVWDEVVPAGAKALFLRLRAVEGPDKAFLFLTEQGLGVLRDDRRANSAFVFEGEGERRETTLMGMQLAWASNWSQTLRDGVIEHLRLSRPLN